MSDEPSTQTKSTTNGPLQLVIGLIKLTRWSLVLLALATTCAGAYLCNISFDDQRWIFFGVSNGLLSAASMVINDWHDVDEDKINKPDRPIPSGMVPRHIALTFAIFLAVVSILFAVAAETVLGIVTAAMVAVSLAYTLKFKHITAFGNFTVGTLAAYPLWGWLFVVEGNAVLVIIACSTTAFIMGKEIIKTAEDYAGDAAVNIMTVATRWGIGAANKVGLATMALGVALAWIPVSLNATNMIYQFILGITSIVVIALVAHSFIRAEANAAISGQYSRAGHGLLFFMFLAIAFGIEPSSGM